MHSVFTLATITAWVSALVSASLVTGCYDPRQEMHDSIWDAIASNDTAYIVNYAANNGDMSARKVFSGETHLQYAYEHNSKAAFHALLSNHADIQQELRDGTGIIHRVVLDDDTWWLEQLIVHRADVNAWSEGTGTRMGTPLHFCIVENKVESAKLLTAAGAKVDCPSDQFGSPTLFEASFHYRWEIVLILLHSGADMNYGPTGKTFIDGLRRRGYGIVKGTSLEGFGDVVRFLKAEGYGEEVFEDCLWGEKKYEDYLKDKGS